MASVDEIFYNPLHPYTRGLLESIPNPAKKKKRLFAIPGIVPNLMDLPVGCKFCTRCDQKMDICEVEEPPMVEIKKGRFLRCHLSKEMISGTQATVEDN